MRWENNISEWTGLKFWDALRESENKINRGKGLLGPWRPNGHHDYGIGEGAGVLYNWYIYNKGTWALSWPFDVDSSLIFLRLSRESFLFYLIFNIIQGVFWYRPFTTQERQRWLSLTTAQCTDKSRFTDNHFIQTPHYYSQFALSLGNETPYIFSKFNPLHTDTPSETY